MEARSAPAARTSADEARDRAMGAGLVDDPYPTLHALRSRCPVIRGGVADEFGVRAPVAASEAGTFSVLSLEEALDVLRDPKTFSSHWYDAALGDSVGKALISLDPPEHQRHRSLLQPAFSQRETERWEREIVQPVVAGYLDPLVPRGRADLYAEFAAHVPIHVTAAALGLPPEDEALFVDWAVTMTSPVETPERRLAASRAVQEYIRPLVDERRARPRRDLLGLLVRAQVPDDAEADVRRDPLTDQELADFVRLLIVAGASTVYRAYGVLLFALLTNPEQLAGVREDRSLVATAIEESLRWEQPVTSVGRSCTHDTELAGTPIPQGSSVLVEIGAANHDPDVWPDPDRFDISRPSKQHVAFGFGHHRCLGIHLARMELRVMLEATLDRLPGLHLDPEADRPRITGLQFRMVTGLPVVWETHRARGQG